MLLTSVIIVLREVLEAALIIGVLLALGNRIQLSRRWASLSIGAGLLGAIVYAGSTATVSDWFDGMGQEVINALMQIVIYCCLVLIIIFIRRSNRSAPNYQTIVLLMMASVTIGITREGSEILIYLSSFLDGRALLQPVLLGSLVGAGIGASVGALAYYALLNIKRSLFPCASIAVIMLIGAGMAGQAALLLIQADWLPSRSPLWDSSSWIGESSVTGQLLYALIGYEATPTPIQAFAYFAGLLLPLMVMIVLRPGADADA